MARGQSPYQGQYTVPLADFSGIERAGAAWGEAFKGIGQQIEKYQLKKQERGALEKRLEGMVKGIAENNPEGLVDLFGAKSWEEMIEKGIAGNQTTADLQGMIGQVVGYQDVRAQAIKSRTAQAQVDTLQAESERVQQDKNWSLGMADVHDAAKEQVRFRVEVGLDNRDRQIAELRDELGAPKKLKVDNIKKDQKKKVQEWIKARREEDPDFDLRGNLEFKAFTDSLKAPVALQDQRNKDNKSKLEELSLYKFDDARDDAIRELPEDMRYALTEDREWWAQGRGKRPNQAAMIAATAKTDEARHTLEKADIKKKALPVEDEAKLEAAALRAGLEGEVSDAELKELNVKTARSGLKLKNLEVDEKRALAKMNKDHPAGEIFSHTLDSGVKVYVMWTGQTFQVVPTGELTEADSYKAMFSIFGDKITDYYKDTRNSDTGEIEDWDEIDPSMEQALIKLLTDRGAEPPKDRFISTEEWNQIKDKDEDQRAIWHNKGRPMPKEGEPTEGDPTEGEPAVKKFKSALNKILKKD